MTTTRQDPQTARQAVISQFLGQCRLVHENVPAGLSRTVRISDLRKTYRVPLVEADLTLTRDEAMAALAQAYRTEFNAIIRERDALRAALVKLNA